AAQENIDVIRAKIITSIADTNSRRLLDTALLAAQGKLLNKILSPEKLSDLNELERLFEVKGSANLSFLLKPLQDHLKKEIRFLIGVSRLRSHREGLHRDIAAASDAQVRKRLGEDVLDLETEWKDFLDQHGRGYVPIWQWKSLFKTPQEGARLAEKGPREAQIEHVSKFNVGERVYLQVRDPDKDEVEFVAYRLLAVDKTSDYVSMALESEGKIRKEVKLLGPGVFKVSKSKKVVTPPPHAFNRIQPGESRDLGQSPTGPPASLRPPPSELAAEFLDNEKTRNGYWRAIVNQKENIRWFLNELARLNGNINPRRLTTKDMSAPVFEVIKDGRVVKKKPLSGLLSFAQKHYGAAFSKKLSPKQAMRHLL
ncbi:MAG: hypothetical protein Q8P12_01505, partial [bacterium]|nr:hypothetical protein [bacterium]